MGRTFFIMLILPAILALTACSEEHEAERTLSEAESLMDKDPNRAFLLLDSLKETTKIGLEKNRMRLELLHAQAMNKTFRLMDTLTVMENVVRYYETHGNENDKMMAKYMLGCVFRDRKNNPVALRNYQDALAHIDTTKVLGCRQACRIYAQMANIFKEKRSSRQEIEVWDKAVGVAWKAKDTLTVINYLYHQAGAYNILGNEDKALSLSIDAYKLAAKIGRMSYAAEVLPLRIFILLRRKNFAEAKEAMTIFERFFGTKSHHGEISKGWEIYYGFKGKYYEGMGRNDSALFYYRKLLEYQDDMSNTELACEGLMSVYANLGKADSVSKYAKLYAKTNDSAWVEKSSTEVSRMKALYEYDSNRRHATESKQKAERYWQNLIVSVIISVCLLSMAIWYIRRLKKNKRLEQERANKEYADILAKYVKLQKDIQLMESSTEKYKKEKQRELYHLQKALAMHQSLGKDSRHIDVEHAMINNKFVLCLHKNAGKGEMLSDAEWDTLRKIIAVSIPSFMETIDGERYGLSEKEKMIAILTKLHFSPTEMAALLNLTKQRVSNIRSDINKKMFGHEGTKTLDSNIRSLK